MGHLTDRELIELSGRGLILALRKKKNDLCEPCIYDKRHKIIFASSIKRSEVILELVPLNV